MTERELNTLVEEMQQRSATWAGEKGEAYWAGYAAGALRAIDIYRQSKGTQK